MLNSLYYLLLNFSINDLVLVNCSQSCKNNLECFHLFMKIHASWQSIPRLILELSSNSVLYASLAHFLAHDALQIAIEITQSFLFFHYFE